MVGRKREMAMRKRLHTRARRHVLKENALAELGFQGHITSYVLVTMRVGNHAVGKMSACELT